MLIKEKSSTAFHIDFLKYIPFNIHGTSIVGGRHRVLLQKPFLLFRGWKTAGIIFTKPQIPIGSNPTINPIS